jgi:hypothetical protein
VVVARRGRSPRRRLAAGLVVVALVVGGWLLWRREPAWALALAPHAAEVDLWQDVELAAEARPAAGLGAWEWRWRSPGCSLVAAGPRARWRCGVLGDHRVEVTARSPWGTERTASAVVRVRMRPARDLLGRVTAPPASLPAEPALPYRIADVIVSKPVICRGEATGIRVVVEDQRGLAAQLLPTIGGQRGWEVDFTPARREPGLYEVPIMVLDPATRSSLRSAAYVALEDCVAPWHFVVLGEADGSADDRWRFEARLAAGDEWERFLTAERPPGERGVAPPRARADHYRWDFGDGVAARTVEPRAQHQFPGEERRPHARRETVYVTRVEACDATDRPLVSARTLVVLTNSYAVVKHDSGILQLKTVSRPYARLDRAGVLSAEVALLNTDDTETVELGEAAEYALFCTGSGDEAPHRTTLAPARLFGVSRVRPGEVVRGRWEWPAGRGPVPCRVDLLLDGQSTPGGMPVTGVINLDNLDATGPRSWGGQTGDRRAVELLQKVRTLLGDPDVVTDDDVGRLEQEGALPRGARAVLRGETPPE